MVCFAKPNEGHFVETAVGGRITRMLHWKIMMVMMRIIMVGGLCTSSNFLMVHPIMVVHLLVAMVCEMVGMGITLLV